VDPRFFPSWSFPLCAALDILPTCSCEQEITVNGDKTPNLKVIWVERYRKGTATLSDGRKETFEVCVGLRWKLKKD
jgi:hypothetical protein